MSFGFEVYKSDGALLLSSDSIAYILLDTFDLPGYASGSKTYSDLLPGMVLKADYTIGDISWGTAAANAVTDSLVDGYFELSVVGNQLFWDWYNPNGEGWDFSAVTVRVFGG